MVNASFLKSHVVLEHFHYDVFLLKPCLAAHDLVLSLPFYSDTEGNIEKLALKLEPTVDIIKFKRIVKNQSIEDLDLLSLAGEYVAPGISPSRSNLVETKTLA